MWENTKVYSNFYDNWTWKITDIFRWNIPDNAFYVSSAAYDQFIYAWKTSWYLKKIRLDHIINADTIKKLQNWETFNWSELWKLTTRISEMIWKPIRGINIWDYKYLDDLDKPQYWYEFIDIIY